MTLREALLHLALGFAGALLASLVVVELTERRQASGTLGPVVPGQAEV